MKKEILNSYLAGLIDGEGTITLSKERATSKYRFPVVSMSSTSIELINIFVENYGGIICKHKVYKEYHKKSYSWRVTRNAAIILIENIIDYMLEPSKVYRGQLILNEYKKVTSPNGKYTDKQHTAKIEFENRFFHPSDSIE